VIGGSDGRWHACTSQHEHLRDSAVERRARNVVPHDLAVTSLSMRIETSVAACSR